ncbi:MAG: hypothetical protein JO256_04815, partial [Alphaproteobacteria bacterium]|nr:hypothetical protein [Alphaproteobacteria bacterium]
MAEAAEAEGHSGKGMDAAGTGAAALSVSLSGADREEANAFLKDQRRLIHLQMEEMRAEEPYKLSHYRLRRFSDWAKAAFEFSLGLIALAIVAIGAASVWNALHSDGLIVESFTVPPELAEKGLSGQVVAGQLTDLLIAMQAETSSSRAARSYSNNWGDDIKVEIPETGVSVGEAWRFLRRWLGNETHVGGEVWKTDSGIAMAARVSGGGSSVVRGGAGDLDALIQKTAEDIYRRTQPYRFALYLASHGRQEEALGRFKALALNGPAGERGWGYLGWSNMVVDTAYPAERERLLLVAQQYDVAVATSNLGNMEAALGRAEAALNLLRKARDMVARDSGMGQKDAQVRSYDGSLAASVGDWSVAVESRKYAIATNLQGLNGSLSYPLAAAQISDHDLAGARATMENPLPSNAISPISDQLSRMRLDGQMAIAQEDWARAYDTDQATLALERKYPARMAFRRTRDNPGSAVLAARLGKFAEAEALLRPLPPDCYQCLYSRAIVADLEGQHERADWWFARAVAQAPSLPIAEQWWGKDLLDRGKPDDAIVQFKRANQKSPHFPDPLQGWGEALMAKNQSHLA